VRILFLVQIIHDLRAEVQLVQCPVVLLALAVLANLAARRCTLRSLLRIIDVFGRGRMDFTLRTCRYELGCSGRIGAVDGGDRGR
jgi:hypothetical protein